MKISRILACSFAMAGFLLCGCHQEARVQWALVIHGGAGSIDPSTPAEQRAAYVRGLSDALGKGRSVLEQGRSSLDAVEQVLRVLEDNPLFNAGRGAVFNWEGKHEMDASIMEGRDRRCGAVAGVRDIRHPISLARLVMERTRHVLLAGSGAEAFAEAEGVERMDPEWFDTERRRESLAAMKDKHGTVGCVALDRNGDLAAGTSTGGLTGKRWGRIGDSPIIGAGTWAENGSCGVSCTGIGEEYIRLGVAQRVADLMEYAGLGVREAAHLVIHRLLKPGDGGLIAMDAAGNVAMEYNTRGMFRARASSSEGPAVWIWEKPEK